jgi:hypothetical protein
MAYAPPSGWLETTAEPNNYAEWFRFHVRKDCARIQNPDTLREVDKPYSAPWCPGCAADGTPAYRTL